MRFQLSSLLMACVIVAVASWIFVQMFPHHGTAAESRSVPISSNSLLREFPVGASNFSWHFGGFRNPNTYYEFDMGESSFIKWIHSHPRLKKVDADSLVRVFRYDRKTRELKYHDLYEYELL